MLKRQRTRRSVVILRIEGMEDLVISTALEDRVDITTQVVMNAPRLKAAVRENCGDGWVPDYQPCVL
jgi:hypothetical protein